MAHQSKPWEPNSEIWYYGAGKEERMRRRRLARAMIYDGPDLAMRTDRGDHVLIVLGVALIATACGAVAKSVREE